MPTGLSKSHTVRNFILCSVVSFLFFLVGSFQVLNYLLADKFIPRSTPLLSASLELGLVTTLVVSLIALPLGYAVMFFFGRVVSTRAIRLYLYIFRGKSVIASKTTDLKQIAQEKKYRLMLGRQVVYFSFILAVVISFAIYLSRHGVFPIVSPLTRTSDVIALITQDYVTLTMSGSLMILVVGTCATLLWRAQIEDDRRRTVSHVGVDICSGCFRRVHSSLLDS